MVERSGIVIELFDETIIDAFLAAHCLAGAFDQTACRISQRCGAVEDRRDEGVSRIVDQQF